MISKEGQGLILHLAGELQEVGGAKLTVMLVEEIPEACPELSDGERFGGQWKW